jgi:hypothetical protein
MTKKRSIDSSADARLAREIEDLLAIDPSPEFLARLRTHLAEAPPLLDARAMGPRKRWWYFRLPGSIRLPVPMGIAIAAMVAAALVLVVLRWPARETPHKVVAVEVPAETEAVTVPASAPPPSPAKPPVRKSAEPEEIETGFFPLMVDPPPFERGLLIRITVPASAMRAVGLPVGDNHLSDPVQADVLMGQDDLVRAIRFVSYRKSRD